MTDFLLLELDGVVERLLWCLLVDLTEFLLEELSGIAITLPLALPTFFYRFLDWIFYNFDITKIPVIGVIWGRGNKVPVVILCIATAPLVIHVPSCIWFCRSSLSGPWRCSGMQNSGRTTYLSASQYFNIIVWGFSVCEAFFCPLGCHPCPCAWRVRPSLFRFNPFLLFLELSPLLGLAIARDLLERTFSPSLRLSLTCPLLPLEGATAPPPLSPSSFPFRFFFALSDVTCLFCILPLSSASDLSLLSDTWNH